jgi:hypothetical protein
MSRQLLTVTKSCGRFLFSVGSILLWALLTLVMAWPTLAHWLDNTPQARPPRADGVNYLIVAPEALEGSAQAWANYRRERGYATKVVLLSSDTTTVEHIRGAIHRAYIEGGRPYPFFVLLLGHAHPTSSFPASYLPAAYFCVDEKYVAMTRPNLRRDAIASDDAYVVEDDFASPLPIAIGRVPARTDEEAMRVLERTRSYETHPPRGSGRTQIEIIAAESGDGVRFNQLVEWLLKFMGEEYLPADYRWHALHGSPHSAYAYPIEEFPREAAHRLDQGALLVAYLTHGSADWLGPVLSADGRWERILNLDDLSMVKDAGASVVTMLACGAGEYDSEGDAVSMAEALLLQPGGAVVTYAASRVTFAAPNARLGKDTFQGLLIDRAPTAGEWIWQAESGFRNPGADYTPSAWLLVRAIPTLYDWTIEDDDETPDVDMQTQYVAQLHAYNLFGDPALALAYPETDLDVRARFPWQPFGEHVAFTGDGKLSPGQVVTITLDALPSAILSQDADGIAARYAQANDKTVNQVNVTVDAEGRFTGKVQLPPDLPSGKYLLRAVSIVGDETFVGTCSIYLGRPPIGDALSSAMFWWLLVSVVLARRFAPAARCRSAPASDME